MSDARIGRLLLASLHQAIADELPVRLDFYEYWLGWERLRGAGVGPPAFAAALSFLRGEGPAYDAVTARAGRYAADWGVADLGRLTRLAVHGLPRRLRMRGVLWVARGLVQAGYAGSRTAVRHRRDEAELEIQGSLFCDVRGVSASALCGFYVAMIQHLVNAFDLTAHVQGSRCQATGSDRCCIAVMVRAAPAAESGETERAA